MFLTYRSWIISTISFFLSKMDRFLWNYSFIKQEYILLKHKNVNKIETYHMSSCLICPSSLYFDISSPIEPPLPHIQLSVSSLLSSPSHLWVQLHLDIQQLKIMNKIKFIENGINWIYVFCLPQWISFQTAIPHDQYLAFLLHASIYNVGKVTQNIVMQPSMLQLFDHCAVNHDAMNNFMWDLPWVNYTSGHRATD